MRAGYTTGIACIRKSITSSQRLDMYYELRVDNFLNQRSVDSVKHL